MRYLGCTLVFVALAGAAAGQDEAAAVVKKAIEAHGGAAALAKARTAKTTGTGTLTVSGLDIAFTATSVYQLPDRYKAEIAGEVTGLKLTALQVVNGKKVKVKTTLGGQPQPVDEKLKEETLQAALLQDVTTLTPLAEGGKYTIKSDKDADLPGGKAAVVVVTGTGLRDTKLYFDRTTGRLVKTERKALTAGPTGPVQVTEETVLSDFKPVDKAVLPMKTVTTHDGKKFMTLTVTEWKLLETVDAKEFGTDD